MEKELRRGRSTLQILGVGMIVFALWDIAKYFLIMLMIAPDETGGNGAAADPFPVAEQPENDLAIAVGVLVLLMLLLILGLALRIRIGRAARAEGLGRPHRGYLGICFAVFAVQVFLFGLGVWSFASGYSSDQTLLQIFASLLLELCSLITTGELGLTALKVRKLEKQLSEAG